MRICFVSKYPPIQGGVSMHCYWAARGLAERGHDVFVVTNANEVEAEFRIALTEEDRRPGGPVAPVFSDPAGAVEVRSTEPPDRRQLYFIPLNNPTVTRLATIATDVIREQACEVLFSYYLEPYGLAAHLAASWTGVPYVFKHAGSDLNRLMPLRDLRTAYVEVLRGAHTVLSQGRSRRLILDAGVPEDRVSSDVAFGIPTHVFNPEAAAVELADPALPVLGIYGKLGEHKGSFDLLHAMAHLVQSGMRFNLVAVAHGWQERRFRALAEELGLTGLVAILPFMPPWRVPSFIRGCTAIAFLERDFPIAAHGPTIPSEVIACGTCLVLSGEVARKQLFRARIRDRRNLIVVPDPKQTDALADALRFALADPPRAASIGARGHAELALGTSHARWVDSLERVLQAAVAEPRRAAAAPVPRSRSDALDMVAQLFPATRSLMTADDEQALLNAVAGTGLGRGIEDRSKLGVELGRTLLGSLAHGDAITEVCRYELKAHEWATEGMSEPPALDPELRFDAPGMSARRPRTRVKTEVATFAYDVEAVAEAAECGDEPPLIAATTKVLFASGCLPLRVNAATEQLLSLVSEGVLTVDEIADAFGAGTDQCLSVLEGLYWEGIVEFDRDDGHALDSDRKEVPVTIV